MPPLTLIIGNKNYSSWSLRAWLVLSQTGASFQEIRIPLDTPTTHAEIRRYSPAGRVPILQVGSLTIWDSLAIAEYLAEQFPAAHLWPKDVGARALARAISAEMHAGFADLRQHLPMDCRRRYPSLEHPPAVQADIERIQAIWQDCRRQFAASGDFLFGAFSIADAMYAPVVTRFQTYGVALDTVCQSYQAAILGLPMMQAWMRAAQAEPETLASP